MQTSARNELQGTIKRITPGTVDCEVVLDVGGGDEIVAVITNTSAKKLGLAPDMAAIALVKAPWVILTPVEGLRTSARNRLCGEIDTVARGAVNDVVALKLAGGRRITAVVTGESVQQLGLAPGVRACALIKASHVVIAVPG